MCPVFRCHPQRGGHCTTVLLLQKHVTDLPPDIPQAVSPPRLSAAEARLRRSPAPSLVRLVSVGGFSRLMLSQARNPRVVLTLPSSSPRNYASSVSARSTLVHPCRNHGLRAFGPGAVELPELFIILNPIFINSLTDKRCCVIYFIFLIST